MIDWDSNKTEVLMNPRFSPDEKHKALSLLLHFPMERHFWVATSGSQQVKWVALSKEAILTSAKAVNNLLESHSEDVWVNILPPFHVGGLGIFARGYLIQAKVVDAYSLIKEKWNPSAFYDILKEYQASLTALVPAQIYDLIKLGLYAPPSLRAVIIGGGALQDSLYKKGLALGWKLLPSYGLTEASSQVATAEISKTSSELLPSLKILPHMQISIDTSGHIRLKGPSLFSCYALKTAMGWQLLDPKMEGWFLTEDLGTLQKEYLVVLGRNSNFIKIGGESVDLSYLEEQLNRVKLQMQCPYDLALFPFPDPRLGHVIYLAASCPPGKEQPYVDKFHETVLPFEHIRKVHYVKTIPRSPTLKILYKELLQSTQI